MSCGHDAGKDPIPFALGCIIGTCTAYFVISFCVRLASFKEAEQRRKKDVKTLKTTCTVVLILYLIGCILMLLTFIICDPNYILYPISGVFCGCGMIGALIVFSQRLYYTFLHTQFKVSNKLKNYGIVSIVITFTTLVGVALSWAVVVDENIPGVIISIIWMLFLIFNSIYLLSLFIRKLNNIIAIFVRNFGIVTQPQLAKLNQSVSVPIEEQFEKGTDFGTLDVDKGDSNNNNNNNNNNNSGGDSGLSDEQFIEKIKDMKSMSKLIGDMSKYTILVGIAIISTFILAIGTSIVLQLKNGGDIWFIPVFLLDNCINCCCLVLQFEVCKSDYIFCCQNNHKLCEDRYTKRVNQNANTDVKLKRLQSGEIGIEFAGGGSGAPGSLSVSGVPTSAHGVSDGGVASDAQPIGQGVESTISFVAQKSAELQMDDK